MTEGGRELIPEMRRSILEGSNDVLFKSIMQWVVGVEPKMQNYLDL